MSPDEVADVEIEPAAALLTAPGETKTLQAVSRASDGTVVQAPIRWSSSDESVATVDAAGVVTAISAVGTALITATVGDRESPAAYVTVARPVDEAILVDDAQVVIGPTEIAGGTEPASDTEYEVVLRDVADAVPGSIIIGAEGASIAGRVVSTTPEGSDTRVRLIVVSPGELFEAVEFRDTIDLGAGEFTIPEDLAVTYDIVRTGDTFVFTPKAGGTAGGESSSGGALLTNTLPSTSAMPAVAAAPGAQGTYRLPPFGDCESEAGLAGGLPLALSTPPTFNLTVSGTVTREATENGIKIELTGTPTFKFETGLVIKAALAGKVECKRTLAVRNFRVRGWLGVFFGGDVEFGVGFELSGNVTLVSAKVGAEVTIAPTIRASLDCIAECDLDGDVTGGLPIIKPVYELPSLAQLRFEPVLALFGFTKLEAGNADFERLQFDAIEVKTGLELAMSYTLEDIQIDNTTPAGRSNYSLAFKGEVGPGVQLDSFLQYLGLTKIVPLKVGFEVPLGGSPTGKAKADKSQYLPGETVKVTVTLDPGSTTFPIGVGAYNVKRVAVLRRDGLETEVLAEATAASGQTTFEITFESPHLIDAEELFAFVVPVFLPLDPPKLEIGQASVPILFTFDEGLDGWSTYGRGPRDPNKEWGTVEWREQSARLSGVGGAGRRNSGIHKEIALPADAATLTFKASADEGHDNADSRLTVSIVLDGTATTLLSKVYSNSTPDLLYTTEVLDISAFAGKTVTIVFDQDDNGDGLHEHIYVDDIGIDTG